MELNSSNETTTTEHSVNYSTGSSTTPFELSTTLSTTTIQTSTQTNDSPIGIKIKEITKPEEIRITDDRPKILKTIKTSEATATKTSSALHSTETVLESEHEAPLVLITDEISEIQQDIEPEIEQFTTFSFDGSADQPIQLESTDLNTVGHVSMGPKIVRQTDTGTVDETHTTLAPFSAENEIKDEILTTGLDHTTDGPIESTSVKHNTSVLQVGDSVVIFDRQGQTQSIPLRVAGLQRGEDTYDEEDERKEGRKTDDTVPYSTAEYESSSIDPMLEQSSTTEVFEVFYYEPKDMATVSLDFPSEMNTASGDGYIGDDKLNEYFREDGSADRQNVVASTEKLLEDLDTSSGYSPIDRFTDPMLAQQSTVDEKTVSYYYEGSSSTSDEVSTNFDHFASSTSSSQFYSSDRTTTDPDDDIQHDQNINFPHITDDLSIHGSRMEDQMQDEDKLRVNSRIVEGELEKIDMDLNSIINDEDSNKSQDDATSTTSMPLENTNYNDVEGRSPGEPFLIPEWERNQTTVAPFELLSASSNETTEVQKSSAEISSHDNHSIDADVGGESTTNQSDLSSSTDIIDTAASTSESDYEVESIETHSTAGPSQVRESNNLNLFLEGTADFFRIQKKLWNSA